MSYSLFFKIKVMFHKIRGLKVIFRIFSTKMCALYSSHEALANKLGVSIVKYLTPISLEARQFGTEAHKTMLICLDTIKSKYQPLNKCKFLFDLVVH